MRKYVLIPHALYIRDFQHLSNAKSLTEVRDKSAPGSVVESTSSDCGSNVYVQAVRGSDPDLSKPVILQPPSSGSVYNVAGGPLDEEAGLGDVNNRDSDPPPETRPEKVARAVKVQPPLQDTGVDVSASDSDLPSESRPGKSTRPVKDRSPPKDTSGDGGSSESDRPSTPPPALRRSTRKRDIKKDPDHVYWLTG